MTDDEYTDALDEDNFQRDLADMVKVMKDAGRPGPYFYHGPYIIDGEQDICRVEVDANGKIGKVESLYDLDRGAWAKLML